MERESIPFPISLFWSEICSQDLHQTFKNSYINSIENKLPIDNLPWQYSNYGEESGGNLNESRHSNISTTTPRFCNKSTDIQIRSKHKTRILAGGDQFDGHANVPPKGANNRHNQSVQETLIRIKYNPEGINKSYWKTDFNTSSSPPGSSTLLLITNVSDNKAEGQPLLQRQSKSECSLVRRTKVVVPQSKFEQRENYKNSKCRNYNWVGYSKIGGLGAHCQGLTAGGQWSKVEAQLHIIVLEIKAAKLVIEFCFAGWKNQHQSVHLEINNVTALSHLLKMGGRKSAELNKILKEIWVYLIGNKITLTPEHLPSSHNIQADWESCQGLEQVETVSPDICKDNSDNGKAKCRLFCIMPVTSTPTVLHVMETGSLFCGSGDALQQ